MILSRSKGLTTVREAAPAHPPAMKYEATSGEKNPAAFLTIGGLGTVSSFDVEAAAVVLADGEALMMVVRGREW